MLTTKLKLFRRAQQQISACKRYIIYVSSEGVYRDASRLPFLISRYKQLVGLYHTLGVTSCVLLT